MSSSSKRNNDQSSPARPPASAIDALLRQGRSALAAIEHSEITGWDLGPPLVDSDALEGSSPSLRDRIASTVAAERSVYSGLRSIYVLRRAGDLAALLSGLAHGFTHASLRLDRASLERCVEIDGWRLESCEYWEFRGGSWRAPPASLRATFAGKRDARGRWSAQLFSPRDPLLGGFAPYRLRLMASRGAMGKASEARARRPSEIEVATAAMGRAAADAIAEMLGCRVPRAAQRSGTSPVPALIWPEGTRESRTNASRVQWARI